MVSGCALTLSVGCAMSQCADTASIARGRGNSAPSVRQNCVVAHSASAIIGEPCERNIVDSVGMMSIYVGALS
jgi:hypothetical protein